LSGRIEGGLYSFEGTAEIVVVITEYYF